MGVKGKLFCFGLGYSGQAIARELMRDGWQVCGTCRDADQAQQLTAAGIETAVFDGQTPLSDLEQRLVDVTHMLVATPPSAPDGDPVLRCHRKTITDAAGLDWIGYLSTTGVYGDTQGKRVDETAPLLPTSDRSCRRVQAEQDWLALQEQHALPVHIFRLSGIYGPGRSPLDAVRAGKARQVVKPGHKFSRIHVDDIVSVARASMAAPRPGRIYNLCDEAACAPADVTRFACDLLGISPPPEISFEVAKKEMSAMALSFWNDNRLISNDRIKSELGVKLAYPTYREGLQAILSAEASSD